MWAQGSAALFTRPLCTRSSEWAWTLAVTFSGSAMSQTFLVSLWLHGDTDVLSHLNYCLSKHGAKLRYLI